MAADGSEVQSKVTVAIRVKPLDKDDRSGELCVAPHDQNPASTIVLGGGLKSSRANLNFTFDFCHWSLGDHNLHLGLPNPPKEATQATIYEDVGAPVVSNALKGFNCSIFAYGQTGSGKTFTMMGAEDGRKELRGLIPRISEALFKETAAAIEHEAPPPLDSSTDPANTMGRFSNSHHFTVSYIEIYMEKVQDLLKDDEAPQALKVREHPKTGPYVEGATSVSVASFEDIKALIDKGNTNRMVASTSMNSVSSRSHAVFTIQYTKRKRDMDSGAVMDMTSKLNLIDLAGSENANSAGTTGERLKEGSYINKSLLTLGMVIKALAEKGGAGRRGSGSLDKAKQVVPYRDSVLTFLLRDSLGGNSRTTMVATIRPGMAFMEETLSTLRYADRAKSIVNYAVINEDPLTKRIRELQDMIDRLSKDLASSQERELEKSLKITEITEQLMAALVRGTAVSPPPQATSPPPDLSDLDGPDARPGSDRLACATPANTSLFPLLRSATPPPAVEVEDPPPPEQLPPRRRSSRSPSGIANSMLPRPAGPPPQHSRSPSSFEAPPATSISAVEDASPSRHASPRPFLPGHTDGEDPLQTLAKTALSDGDEDAPRTGVTLYQPEEEGQGPGTPVTTQMMASSALPSQQADADGKQQQRQHDSAKSPKGLVLRADGLPKLPASTRTRLWQQGFLMKRGRINPVFKRRWFVLSGSRMLWYSKYGTPDALRGVLCVTGASVEEIDATASGGEPYCFVVTEKQQADATTGEEGVSRRRQWILQASSEDEKKKWIESTREASKQLNWTKQTHMSDPDEEELPVPNKSCKVS